MAFSVVFAEARAKWIVDLEPPELGVVLRNDHLAITSRLAAGAADAAVEGRLGGKRKRKGGWGIGGNPLTTNDEKALEVGKSKG